MIRAFIAIELPEELKQQIAALQENLKRSGADVKWVEPRNLHLTLKFLGNIEEAQVAPLTEALRSSRLLPPPFSLTFEGIGAFPKTTSPRVIWVGLTKGCKELERLVEAVETVCEEARFPKEERPFKAHLTIGRLPARRTARQAGIRWRDRLALLIKRIQVAEFRSSSSARIDRLILFQSTLSPQGPTYTPLAEIPMGRLDPSQHEP